MKPTLSPADFGAWFRALRQEAGYSQAELAQFLGMRVAQGVQNIESGRSPLPPKYISQLAYWLEVPISKIVDQMLRVQSHRLMAVVEKTRRPST